MEKETTLASLSLSLSFSDEFARLELMLGYRI